MRRATDATGHKIASAYGYAYATQQTNPQGFRPAFIIRPPLQTTNNKVLEEDGPFCLLLLFLIVCALSSKSRGQLSIGCTIVDQVRGVVCKRLAPPRPLRGRFGEGGGGRALPAPRRLAR
jgi:hypothetical protein